MKIFLVEDSAVVRERLVAMASELRGAEIVGYVEDARQAGVGFVHLMIESVPAQPQSERTIAFHASMARSPCRTARS